MTKTNELIDRVAAADPDALTECLRLMSEGEDEGLADEMFEAFESVCVLYAMGGGNAEDETEWRRFREIVRYTARLDAHVEAIYESKVGKDRVIFDIAVLEAMQGNNTANVDPQRLQEEIDTNRYSIDFFQCDLEKATQERDFCQAWIHVAKGLLTHPRFTKLSDGDFDELVESVMFVLEVEDDERASFCDEEEAE